MRAKWLLRLQKCEQHKISFSFAAKMKQITNYKSNYTFEQRIVVSVWEHEKPRTEKTMKHGWEIFQQGFGQETLPKKTLLRLEHKYFATANIK